MVKVYVMRCLECGLEYESVERAVFECPECRGTANVIGSYTEGEEVKEE